MRACEPRARVGPGGGAGVVEWGRELIPAGLPGCPLDNAEGDVEEDRELVVVGTDDLVPTELKDDEDVGAIDEVVTLEPGTGFAPDAYKAGSGLGGKPFCADRSACTLALFTPAFSSKACKLGILGCAGGVAAGRGGREDKSGGGPGSSLIGVYEAVHNE